ncbi:MAG: hypothetical protein Q8R00_00680 [Candidatus Nanoarchaeia archaeon]|nr:hypothetical protein [Candidatus Nanoarchaeia archaeon]
MLLISNINADPTGAFSFGGGWGKFISKYLSKTTTAPTQSTTTPTNLPQAPTSTSQTPTYTSPSAPAPPTGPVTTPTAPSTPSAPSVPTAPTTPSGPSGPSQTPYIPTAPSPPLSGGQLFPTIVQPPILTIPSSACGVTCNSFNPCPTGMTCATSQIGSRICTHITCKESCNDGADNDLDGLVDCADPDCAGVGPNCILEYGWVGGWLSSATLCRDFIDNDLDGLVDCADPDCAAQSCREDNPDHCQDGIDNNGNGLIDGADPDCTNWATESFAGGCFDGLDNDKDGLIDCGDLLDCGNHYLCAEGISIPGIGNPCPCPRGLICDTRNNINICITGHCFNQVDDDNDGTADCGPYGTNILPADQDCINAGACTELNNCMDGVDNDRDGLFDCQDTSDCSSDISCGSCMENDRGNLAQYGTTTAIIGGSRIGVGGALSLLGGGLQPNGVLGSGPRGDMCTTANHLVETTCPTEIYLLPPSGTFACNQMINPLTNQPYTGCQNGRCV